jgi:adenylate cyclase
MSGSNRKISNLANISHELRTPLNAIIGYCEMLVEEWTNREWEPIASNLRKINQAGCALLEIIKEALVFLLNDLFCMFDDLVRQHDLEKIHAIGDEYVVAAGLLKPRPDHAEAVADFALAMLNGLEEYNASHDRSLEIRIGIETGPVIAGVIGKTQFSYCLWGDAINTASRMQSHGLSGRIHMTENTYLRLKELYLCEAREAIQVKGKGEMRTYFLNDKRETTST